MGYLMLGIALFAGAVKVYCGKRIGGRLSETGDAFLASLIRMAIAAVLGFALLAVTMRPFTLAAGRGTVLSALLCGVATALNVTLWLLCIREGSVLLVEIFAMLSVMIPLLGSRILYGDRILPVQWAGYAVLIAAVWLICGGKGEKKTRLTPRLFLLVFLNSVVYGLAALAQKIFANLSERGAVTDTTAVFNFYTYVFAAGTLAVCLLLMRLRRGPAAGTEPEEKGRLRRLFRGIIVYIAIMAACLYVNYFCIVQASRYLSPVLIFPFSQGVSLVIVTLMATLIFHEKFTWKTAAGVALACAGVWIINVLPEYLAA